MGLGPGLSRQPPNGFGLPTVRRSGLRLEDRFRGSRDGDGHAQVLEEKLGLAANLRPAACRRRFRSRSPRLNACMRSFP